ncbi:MAG: acetyl-CoA C-acyltransferase [Acidimicrobiia bacterium]
MSDVVVVGAVRSAIGRRNGALAHTYATELLGDVLAGLVERTGIDPGAVGHVLGGCVNQLGMQASNVTRNAWLGAGLPLEVPAVTVNTQCGSSQEATTLAHALLGAGLVDVAIACGVEAMSQVPMGSTAPSEPDYGQPRGGRYATVYEPTTQFEGAERIAETWQLTRDELDGFGKRSQDLAASAWEAGRFDDQILGLDVAVTDDRGDVVGTKRFDRDEGLRATTLEGLSGLKTNLRDRDPAFHTAGTSSQISDGASAVLLTTAERADQLGLRPRARIVASVLAGSDPVHMLTGPIPATAQLLERSGLALDDIDLFEVNEAFASVVLAWRKETGADPDKVNVNGGAIALGHPLGATGTVLLTKALHELERRQGRYALVTMCCGGGLGTGTILERL